MPIKSIPDSLHKMKVYRYSVIGPDNLPSIINIIDLQMNSAEKNQKVRALFRIPEKVAVIPLACFSLAWPNSIQEKYNQNTQ